jgi:predicted site-specific integrase-resolvase
MTEPLAPPDRLLRPGETAQLLGVSLSTLATWRRTGRIHATSSDGHGRYHPTEVARVAQRMRARP